MIMQQKSRIEWIDCLRGLTMILVIYRHFTVFVFKVEDSFGVTEPMDSFICDFLKLVRMPLFFFVSGFIAYNGGGGILIINGSKKSALHAF